MASVDFMNIITYLVVVLCWSTVVFGQNIIKEHTSISDLSSKVSDLKPDGSQYGVGGFNYYGTPLPTPGLNYGHTIAPTPFTAKPYYPTALATGYYPQGFAVPGKPTAPYNGYGYSAVGYPATFGFASGAVPGVSYPGVLGYSGGFGHNYHHHNPLSPHGYNGVHYTNGYFG